MITLGQFMQIFMTAMSRQSRDACTHTSTRQMSSFYTRRQTTAVPFSLQVNCTHSTTSTGRRILVPTFVDRVSRGQRDEHSRPLI
jgi:hypothetical protein